jgi:hypothetical protein
LCRGNACATILITGRQGATEVTEVKKATGQFKITGGHEETYAERNPGRLTRSGGAQEFSGDIEGTGRIEWLMCYRGDRSAEFVGMQQIEGTLDGRTGEFVLTSTGAHDGVRSKGTWTVVSGCGKGDLSGIRGNGTWLAGPGPQATFELSYAFD